MKKLTDILLLSISCILMIGCNSNQKEGEMLLWTSNNAQEIEYISAKTSKWNKTHPEKTIRFQPIPEGQSSEEIILASVVGGTTPAIYANMWQGNVEMYAQADVLVRLDTLPGFMELISQRCPTDVITEITSEDGHIYQIPWKVNPIMTLYNENLFKNAGIEDLPETYSDYLDAARLITEDTDGDGYTDRWIGYTSVKPIWYQRLFNFYPLYLAATGGEDLIENDRAAFKNDRAVGVFSFLQKLYNNDYFSRQQMSSAQDPFIMQRTATLFTGPWQVPYLEKYKPEDLEYGFLPMMVPADTFAMPYTYGDPKNIVIFKTCPDVSTAWEFLKSLISKQGDLDLLKITGQFPRRKNISGDTYFESFLQDNPKLIPFAVQADYIKGVDNHPHIVEVLDIISQEYEACVIYGRKTPKNAVNDAAEAVNVLLKNL